MSPPVPPTALVRVPLVKAQVAESREHARLQSPGGRGLAPSNQSILAHAPQQRHKTGPRASSRARSFFGAAAPDRRDEENALFLPQRSSCESPECRAHSPGEDKRCHVLPPGGRWLRSVLRQKRRA